MKLIDIYKIQKGKKMPEVAYSENAIRYIQIEDLRNNSNLKYCPLVKNIIKVNKDDVIIAWDGANAGTIGYGIEGAIGSTLAVLRCNNKNIFTPYVGRYLQTKSSYLRSRSNGAAIPHVSRYQLDNIEIPLPPLPIQKKIAHVLDKADQLRQKRKEQIKKLDDLTQSVFLDMFGDIKYNTKKWKVVKIKSVVSTIQNVNPLNYPRTSYEYIDISAVNNQTKKITNKRQIMGADAPSRARQVVVYDDILVSTVRPNLNTIAMVKSKYPNILASTGYCVLRINKSVASNNYVFEICKSKYFVDYLTKIAKGANYPAVSDYDIKNLNIPFPPIDLQNKFSLVIDQVESTKNRMYVSLTKIEEEFNSLLQKAFTGELEFNDKAFKEVN